MNHFVILDIFGRFGGSWQNLNTGHFDVAKTSIFLLIKCCQMLAKIDCKKSAKNCFVRNTARSCHSISILQIIEKKEFHTMISRKLSFNPEMIVLKKIAWFQQQKVPLCFQVDFDLTLIKVTRQNLFAKKDDTLDCYLNVLISLTNYSPKMP